MHFIVEYKDREGVAEKRQALRTQHIEFRKGLGPAMLLAGPLLADDGNASVGSMIIVEAADRAAADALVGRDPFVTEGVFDVVSVRPFRLAGFNAPKKD